MDMMIATPEQGTPLDLMMAKDIGEALHAAYPGHLWAVNVRGDQGILTIHNLFLSGNWGCTLHLDKRYSASDLKHHCIMAGGEILERYNLRRGRADDDAIAAMPMTTTGRVIGDMTA